LSFSINNWIVGRDSDASCNVSGDGGVMAGVWCISNGQTYSAGA
jgi:hypothetical protein